MTQSPSALIAHVPFCVPPQPPGHTVKRQSQLATPLHAAGSALHAGGGGGPHPGHPAGQTPESGEGQNPAGPWGAQYATAPHVGEQSCVVVCCGCIEPSGPPSLPLELVPHAMRMMAMVVMKAFIIEA
jgi:hypothetical protein